MHWRRLCSFCLCFRLLWLFPLHIVHCLYLFLLLFLFIYLSFSFLFCFLLLFLLLYLSFSLLSDSLFSLFLPLFFFYDHLFRNNVLFCCILCLLLLFLVWCFFLGLCQLYDLVKKFPACSNVKCQ